MKIKLYKKYERKAYKIARISLWDITDNTLIDVKNICEEIFSFTSKTDEFIFKGDIKNGMQKYFIDNVFINKLLLTELGIKKNNIIDSEICSVCSQDKINSFRAEGKDFKLATQIISL